MPSRLHAQRLDAVVDVVLRSGAMSVLDLGCGTGDLLVRLVRAPQFRRIVGVDISSAALLIAGHRLRVALAQDGERLALRHGSFAVPDAHLAGFDAAALVEAIEHVDPDRLSTVERAVFGCYRPGIVLITTPNRDYDALHDRPGGRLRHPDHRFEWTRARFEAWAGGVAGRHGYGAAFTGIGWPHPSLGSPTQMATLVRTDRALA